MATTFKGAEQNAYNGDWNTRGEFSPDKDLSSSNTLQVLRQRSHQSIKDNPVVAGLQQAYVNMVIGAGPTIYSASDNKIQRKQINDLFEFLLVGTDMSGMRSFNNLLEDIVNCAFADGDILINLPMDEQRDGVQTVVELIEASRIDTPQKEGRNANVRLGVKYDAKGRVLGYYVRKAEAIDHGTGGNVTVADEFDFLPVWKEADGLKRQVSFLFKAPVNNRPLASRQYPLIAPCLPILKHVDDFVEAVIVGARVAACYAAFIMTKNPSAANKAMIEGTGGGVDAKTGQKYSRLQPGTVMYLNMNEEVSFASPNKPGDNTDSFLLRNYKNISMCLRIPYIIAFLDTSEMSYSAWRGAVLESQRTVSRWRRDLSQVIDWILGTMIFEASTLGLVRGDLSKTKLRKRWPSHGLLDPEKEARANKTDLVNKTKSRQIICDEQSISFDEVEEDLLEEALLEVDRQAAVLIRQKEWEAKAGVVFNPEPEKAGGASGSADRKTTKREGEKEGDDLDEDDAKTRRKDDGNW